MSIEDDLREVVAACKAKLNAQVDLDEAVARRERALWRLVHEDGVRKSQVAPLVWERLRAAGFTDDMIAAAGVSRANVRHAVDRRMWAEGSS